MDSDELETALENAEASRDKYKERAENAEGLLEDIDGMIREFDKG